MESVYLISDNGQIHFNCVQRIEVDNDCAAWGNAMLRAVEELAAAQSFEQVVTHVYHTNRIALAMFESAGFTQIGPPKGGNIFLRKRYMRSPFLA